jgi:bile acid-coenzyme A ligase
MLTFGDQSMTRGQFEARANQRARSLAAEGLGEGDFVTMVLPNGFEFVESCFAAWKLGATPLAVSAALPDNELRAIVDLINPKLVAGASPERLPGRRTIEAGRPLDETLSTEALPEIVCQNWRAGTSGGSTGRPKIIVAHGGGVANPMQPVIGLQQDGVQLNPGPLYHSGPFNYAFAGLFLGAHLIDAGKFDAANLLGLIEKHRVDWLYLVPTMMHRIWRLPEEVRESFDLSSLKTIWHMAAHCPVWLKQHWIDWLGPEKIFELYGASESQGFTTISGEEWLTRKGSVGRAQGGSQLMVADEQGKPLGPGQVGEIYFRWDQSAGPTYHYIGAVAKKIDDWESPGDLGYVDEEGYLYIVDRRTDLIVSGGANVYPAEVEAAIEAHPEVECSVVIGLPDADLGHKVHALVELKEPAKARVGVDELRSHLAEHLVRYKIPRTFEFVETPLRDAAGKVRRSALREERIQAAKASAGAPS